MNLQLHYGAAYQLRRNGVEEARLGPQIFVSDMTLMPRYLLR